MKPYCFHPLADEEYTLAVRYYADIQLELGGRFYDEIERLIGNICRQPDLFRVFDPPARRHFSTGTGSVPHNRIILIPDGRRSTHIVRKCGTDPVQA